MADYTIKNIEDVKDSALDFGIGDKMEARFATRDLGGSIIEPLMMIAVGLVVGVIIIAMYLPMFKMLTLVK